MSLIPIVNTIIILRTNLLDIADAELDPVLGRAFLSPGPVPAEGRE